jgi:hypothetical protein
LASYRFSAFAIDLPSFALPTTTRLSRNKWPIWTSTRLRLKRRGNSLLD